MKFEDKPISIFRRPVIVVGQNPGRQRKGQETGVVWEGNRSADFLMDVIERYELSNLYLTNICNYQDMTTDRLLEGVLDFIDTCVKLQPRKVVALGKIAYDTLSVGKPPLPVQYVPHPSFILRFNKDRQAYTRQLIDALQS